MKQSSIVLILLSILILTGYMAIKPLTTNIPQNIDISKENYSKIPSNIELSSKEFYKSQTEFHNRSIPLSSIEHHFTLDANDPTAFVSVWDTTLTSDYSSGSNQIKLPLEETGRYNFQVDWGDGTNSTITQWNQSEGLHNYVNSGQYEITITGQLKDSPLCILETD